LSSLFSLIVPSPTGGVGKEGDWVAKLARWGIFHVSRLSSTGSVHALNIHKRGYTMPSHILPILNLRGAKLLLAGGTIFGASLAQGDVIYQQDFENNWSNADGLWSSSTNASLGGPYTTVMGRFGTGTVNLSVLATVDNNGGYGGNSGGNPFNITVKQVVNSRDLVPFPDQGGGGGPGGDGGSGTSDAPYLNLGQAIRDQNNNNNGPPMFGPGTYAIHFDLMLFDSWDGNWAPEGVDSFSVAVNGQTLFDEYLYSSAYGAGLNFREPDEIPTENAYNTAWNESIYRDIELVFEITDPTDIIAVDFMGSLSHSIGDESWGLDNVFIEQLSQVRGASLEVPAPGTLVLLGSGFGMMIRRKR